MIVDVAFVTAAVGVFAGVAWLTLRAQRRCICCKPRRLFPTVDARRHHEHIF